MIRLFDQFMIDPPISLAITFTFMVPVISIMLWLYTKLRHTKPTLKTSLILLRCMTLLGIAILLIGPLRAASNQTSETQRNQLHLILDMSQSMNEPAFNQSHKLDKQEATSRINLARELIKQHKLDASEFSDQHAYYINTEKITSTSVNQWSNVAPEHEASPLLINLLRFLKEPNTMPGDILLITDGADTTSPELQDSLLEQVLDHAKRQNRELNVLLPAEEDHKAEIKWSIWPNKDTAFSGEAFIINADLQWYHLPAQTLKLTLYQNDIPVITRIVETNETNRHVSLNYELTAFLAENQKEEIQTWQLKITDTEGNAVEANAVHDKTDEYALIKVIDQRIRVLLIEGSPDWDTSFLLKALKTDPRLDTTTVFQITEARRSIQHYRPASDDEISEKRAFPAGPITLKTLEQYDVVFIGKAVDNMIYAAGNTLNTYLTNGGGLFLYNAQPFNNSRANTELIKALPLEWANKVYNSVSLQPTDDFFDNPELIQGTDINQYLPNMVTLTQSVHLKPNATTLIKTSTKDSPDQEIPALVSGYHGQGRVMVWLMQNSWRWAFTPGQQFDFLPLYTALHTQATRWLALDEDMFDQDGLRLSLNKLRAKPDEPIHITIHSPWRSIKEWDAPPVLKIKQLDRFDTNINATSDLKAHTLDIQPSELQPDQWVSSLNLPDSGRYEIILTWIDQTEKSQSRTSSLLISSNTLEARHKQPNIDLLRKLTDGSNGVLIKPDSGNMALFDESQQKMFEERIEHWNQRAESQMQLDFLLETTWEPWVNWGLPVTFLVSLLIFEWFIRKAYGVDQ